MRGGLDLSFALVARDEEGHVIVPSGPWAGQRWPEGMLDRPAARIGDVRCQGISDAPANKYVDFRKCSGLGC
ncbi:hypothetical protein Acy02nite_56140 [Actinoplanes cyaneus]|uniref:Uncharacterized protein n=1 Tax=Actinoplanes cyaneus TaxID=52696 RepID=A0A919M7V5_9ACTN|nr:hypothetical protein Acy02nite_56140 [Actinoplanes cyaneus]